MVLYDDDYGAVFVNLTLGQGFGNAAAGDSYAGIEDVRGSMFADTLIGEGGANRLEGGAGDDVPWGDGRRHADRRHRIGHSEL